MLWSDPGHVHSCHQRGHQLWKESWGKVVLLTYRGTQMLLTTGREWN